MRKINAFDLKHRPSYRLRLKLHVSDEMPEDISCKGVTALGKVHGSAAKCAPAPRLARGPRLTGDTVLQRHGRACLDQLMSQEQAVCLGDAEGVHQMRVAIRRLHAILSAFAPFLPKEARRWASRELRWLTKTLGEARNLDVFASRLFVAARGAVPQADDLECLAVAAEERRQAAHRAAREAIYSVRYTTSVQALSRWFDNREWSPGGSGKEIRLPINELAPILLDRCRRRVEKCSKDFVSHSEEQHHQLRIAVKKMRYAAELLADLFDTATAKRLIQRLKHVQDDLGDLNDVRVGHEIVSCLAESSTLPSVIADAGYRILAWHRCKLAGEELQRRRRLQQLLETTPFWRAIRPGSS